MKMRSKWKGQTDLMAAIIKLKKYFRVKSKRKGKTTEAYEKVNRKFNDVYTKLFNGGNAN